MVGTAQELEMLRSASAEGGGLRVLNNKVRDHDVNDEKLHVQQLWIIL